MHQRVEALGRMVAARTAGQETDAGERRRLIQGKLKELERQRRKDRRDTVRHLILQTGLPLSLRGFVIASAACGFAAGGLLALALDGICSFSVVPLRVAKPGLPALIGMVRASLSLT